MSMNMHINAEHGFATGKGAGEVAIVSFIRRVELGQMLFKADNGISNVGTVAMRTWMIAPAVNGATMFE